MQNCGLEITDEELMEMQNDSGVIEEEDEMLEQEPNKAGMDLIVTFGGMIAKQSNSNSKEVTKEI